MSFYLADSSRELKGELEKILGVKGFRVGEKLDLSVVRSVITEPQPYVLADEKNLDKIKDYMRVLSAIRKSFVPVIFYSESSEKDINNIGLLKGKHYDEYFSKFEKGSIMKVTDYIKERIRYGNPFLDNFN